MGIGGRIGDDAQDLGGRRLLGLCLGERTVAALDIANQGDLPPQDYDLVMSLPQLGP